MDPLSSALRLLKLRCHLPSRFDIGGEQSIVFPDYDGVKCYAVMTGSCWLTASNVPPIFLREGDCFMLSGGSSFSLATDASAPSVEFKAVVTGLDTDASGLFDRQSPCTLAGGYFMLGSVSTNLLLDSLPPIVHLHAEEGQTVMRWFLEQVKDELNNERLGGAFLAGQLAYMMLVHVLRVHLTQSPQDRVGWLYALLDPQLKSAILVLQADPAKLWTVNALAKQVGMSRSIFALRFRQKVGEAPMKFLTRWRILLAASRLAESTEPVLSIALDLGYKSESAFGKAFRRVMGCSPRHYGRQRNSKA